MALPTTPEGWEHAGEACLAYQRVIHERRKSLLGQWVSELEPEEVWSGSFYLKGLTMKGLPSNDSLLTPCKVFVA